MAKKKSRAGARTAAASKTQKLVGPCGDCGAEVEVERVLVIGAKSYKTWRCKGQSHYSIDGARIHTA